MERKQDNLLPIGEALAGLDGPVKALAKSSPQARHHFTQADQVNQLVSASEADPDRGFMARTMALCSLPRTNPGNRIQYQRVNGPYKLVLIAGGGQETALWQSAALAAGLDFNRGRAHSIPCVGFGGFTLGVHAGAWDLQHQWQGTHSLAEPDAVVVSMSCSVGL